MDTFDFARFLINALEAEVLRLEEFNNDFYRGAVKIRMLTLQTGVNKWVKFPQSLKLEATKAIRRAKLALDEIDE